jgi:hypothetical protein
MLPISAMLDRATVGYYVGDKAVSPFRCRPCALNYVRLVRLTADDVNAIATEIGPVVCGRCGELIRGDR